MMKKFNFIFAFLSICLTCINATELKLASINIRVDIKEDSLNPWNIRKVHVFSFIRHQDLDIVCLQEVLWGQMEDFKNAFPDYSYVHRGRKEMKSEAVPILYKSSRYDCLDSGTFWLSDKPDSIGSVGWDGRNPRIATWVRLKDKRTDSILFVINTHLDHIGKVAREKSMELLKCKIKEESSYPSILTGDMNSNAISNPYYTALNHGVMMFDTYQIAKERLGVNYSYHAFGKRDIEERNMVDFIFVTQQIDVSKIEIPKEQINDGVYLSDHCPVVVTLSF